MSFKIHYVLIRLNYRTTKQITPDLPRWCRLFPVVYAVCMVAPDACGFVAM